MPWKDDLNYGLAAFGLQLPDHFPVDAWSEKLGGKPARNTLLVVSASAILFLHFERPHNPKVRDITDALLYCSTCLNVGYADIHPVTKAGKLLGTMLMTYGPALAASMIDGPKTDHPQQEMTTMLRKILSELERRSVLPSVLPGVLPADGNAN